ncbi:MAG: NAD(P)/FAD-dependent oxidoreductase [Deltaproteobacteria bacterium]|nr:MAG: NAD(P)/FAD-dependent oxidoreductase [Deltaproteobacteria bacterium]
MASTPDILIVGGGLAGSVTAIHLARRGHSVLVIERGTFPREKVCGEGMMPHGVAELEALGLGDAIRETGPVSFRGIAYHSGETTAIGDFPGGRTGLGLRRHRIDAALHQACADEPGVEVKLDTRVLDLHLGSEAVQIKTSRGVHQARVVIGADGLHSFVRRKAGLAKAPKGPARYGIRAHLHLSNDAPAMPRVEVFVLDDLEVYLTPTATDELNVAVLCGRALAQEFGEDLDVRLMARLSHEPALRPFLDGAEVLTPPAVWGPLRQRTRAVSADRVLLVGDAAGFIDALTGEGMSLSLVGARLAAEVLSTALHEGDLSARRLRTYDRQRARHGRSLSLLTELLVRGIRHRWLARRIVRNLARHPEAFSTLLGINIGERPIWAIPPRDLLQLTVGR